MSSQFEKYIGVALMPENEDLSFAYIVEALWTANLPYNSLGFAHASTMAPTAVFHRAEGLARHFAEDIIDTLTHDQKLFAVALFQQMSDTLCRDYHANRPKLSPPTGRAVDLTDPDPVRNPDL